MSKKYNKARTNDDMTYLVTILGDDGLTTYSFRSVKSAYKFACIWYITFEETLRHMVRQDPDVIVMDEPFSALDVLTAENLSTAFHQQIALDVIDGRFFARRARRAGGHRHQS